MVFYELDRISDLIRGHRIIIYYIEGETTNTQLCKSVESVMEMLEKKNDDLIIFKVCQNTLQFKQFNEIYKANISGAIALFVINREGIPLTCEEINNQDDINYAFDTLCAFCNLKAVSESEITKVIESVRGTSTADKTKSEMSRAHQQEDCKMPLHGGGSFPVLDSNADSNIDSPETSQYFSTVLQIRLPSGTKETQRFEKNAFLQEVHDFICDEFNLRDFDLKTYNRHVFSASDYQRTLKDLDLIPNGVIIVVFKNIGSTNNYNIWRMIGLHGFWFVFARTTSVFYYIQGIIYAFWNNFFSSGTPSPGTRQNRSQRSHSGVQGGVKSSSNSVKRSLSRFGNIHTLRRNDESDDENNRYNGNSTQQK